MFKHADRAEFRSPAHIFLGLAGVVAVVWLASKLAPLFILQDFSIYWRATKEWLHGANPYDLPPHTQYVSGEFGELDRLVSTLKVWSPPTFLLAMVPFSISSLEFGKSLYLSLVILTTWGWLALTYRSICDAYALKGVIPTLAGAFLALLIFPWSPTIDMLRWGGVSVLSSMAFLIIAYSSSLSTGAWTVVFILFFSETSSCSARCARTYFDNQPKRAAAATRRSGLSASCSTYAPAFSDLVDSTLQFPAF